MANRKKDTRDRRQYAKDWRAAQKNEESLIRLPPQTVAGPDAGKEITQQDKEIEEMYKSLVKYQETLSFIGGVREALVEGETHRRHSAAQDNAMLEASLPLKFSKFRTEELEGLLKEMQEGLDDYLSRARVAKSMITEAKKVYRQKLKDEEQFQKRLNDGAVGRLEEAMFRETH